MKFFSKKTADNDILSLIEQRGAARFERSFKVFGNILAFFELFLVFNILFTSSGGNYKKYYLFLYAIMLVTCTTLFLLFRLSRNMSSEKRTQLIKAAEIAFIIIIEIWALGITIVDAMSHKVMDVLVYISVLSLLPSIVFIHPSIGVSTQMFFDLIIYHCIFVLDPGRAKYLFINFSTFALVAIIIYIVDYRIQFDLYEREALLKKTAENDSLTGLKNRFSYSNYIQSLKDHPENRDFAILLLDLNGLKNVNDTLGHSYGDELIQGAAWCIEKAFHKNGLCFRTGGDEFVVLLNKHLDDVDEMIWNFSELCQNWKGELVSSPSISWGLAEAKNDWLLSVDELIELADNRMYAMKSDYYSQHGIDRRKPALPKQS
ncbi:MAG: GGDEF domain-containing protein [Treponema sp.]|nr:GGDEF domain-containing protein [Candidatus Treponema caballi]